MIHTQEDLTALYEKYKPGFYRAALRYLPTARLDDIPDVVNEALLALWKARDSVEHPSNYVLSAIKFLALERTKLACYKKWHDPIEKLEPLQSEELNPEEKMLDEERERQRRARRAAIVNRLPPILRRDYEEWKRNGYKCPEHKHACRATKVRHELAAISKEYAPV